MLINQPQAGARFRPEFAPRRRPDHDGAAPDQPVEVGEPTEVAEPIEVSEPGQPRPPSKFDKVLVWVDTYLPDGTRQGGPAALTVLVAGVVLLAVAVIAGLVWLGTAIAGETWAGAKWTTIGALATVLILVEVFIYLLSSAANKVLTESKRAKAVEAVEMASKSEERLHANREVLTLWEEMVRKEAGLTYRYTMIAMCAVLLVVLVGALIIIGTGDLASQIAVAGLSGIAAALSGMIARSFLEIHRIAQRQLNFYFVEPLVTNYLLNAERLVDATAQEMREANMTVKEQCAQSMAMRDKVLIGLLDAARASVTLGQPATNAGSDTNGTNSSEGKEASNGS